MERALTDINARIALQVRTLRAHGALSLEALALRCGVSRSMISLVERGEANPTAVVLERLACGLGVPLARLFDPLGDGPGPPAPVSRRAEQLEWRDPGSGYRRRNVSPPHWPSPLQLVEIEFPAGAKVTYETAEREPALEQQIWVLSGSIEVTLGTTRHALQTGDALAMRLDAPVSFCNRSRSPARYLVAICAERPAMRGR